MSYLFKRKLIISFLVLFSLTCEDKVWNNPNDADTTLDPSAWAPENLQAQILTDSEIKLTWVQEDTRIDGFRIDRKAGTGNFIQIAEVSTDVTEYSDTGLDVSGAFYDYRVYAFTSNNTSEYSNTAGVAVIFDIDGNIYEMIQIGTQVWMAENLKVTKYRNGDPIPTAYNNSAWSALTTGAYATYNDDASNTDTYGLLYNWYVVDNSLNIAPEGWHVPTDAEWQILVDYLGGSNIAGGKLKEMGATHWLNPNTGATNESGFTALPGGNCYSGTGFYYYLGYYGYFWSSTESIYNSNHAWYWGLTYYYSYVNRGGEYKNYGFSIRCVKD